MLHFLPGILHFNFFLFLPTIAKFIFPQIIVKHKGAHVLSVNQPFYLWSVNQPLTCDQWINLFTCDQWINLFTCDQWLNLFTCDQWIGLFTCDQWASLFTCDQWINRWLVISESTFELWPDRVLNVSLTWPLTFVVYRVFNNTKNQPAVTMTMVTPRVPVLVPHRDSLSPIISPHTVSVDYNYECCFMITVALCFSSFSTRSFWVRTVWLLWSEHPSPFTIN